MSKRDYNNDYASVTQIISMLTNYGLQSWFQRTPYNEIISESNKAKEIGTQIHDAIQDHINSQQVKLSTEYPQEVINIIKGFMQFKNDNPGIVFYNTETKLMSAKHRLNGTIDCIGIIGDTHVLLDWKSARAGTKDVPDIYDSYLWQVSAYAVMLNEEMNIKVSKAMVVSFAKDKIAYNTIRKIDKDCNGFYLGIDEKYGWVKEIC
jgi:ATP-dependent exoDNAse (exonuclease V) beta subunit